MPNSAFNPVQLNRTVCRIPYRRSRFSTELPDDRLYTPSHFWLAEVEPGLWRVGLTRFAVRMLGDLVEHGFEVKSGEAVTVGQTIGWVEAFKAIADLYCVGDGAFAGANAVLETDPATFDKDPYGAGWLYLLRGTPEPGAVGVQGYVGLLDLAIDKIQGKASDVVK